MSEVPQKNKFRFLWLDYSRGLTISLVVFAHLRNGLLQQGLIPGSDDFVLRSMAFTSCTVAVFFFMSGGFIRSAARAPFPAFLEDKLRTVAYPYFLWSLLYFLSAQLFEQHSKDSLALADLWRIVYQPLVHFWFLYALFVFMGLFGLAVKVGISPLWFLVLAVIMRCTEFIGLTLDDGGLLDNIRLYLPYFALGAYINRGEPLVYLSKAPVPLLAVFVLLGYSFAWYAVVSGWRDHPGLILGAIFPGALAMLSLAIILERLSLLRFISYIGQQSLEVYLAHVWGYTAVRVILYNVLGVENLWIHIVLGMSGGIGFALAVSYLGRRFGLNYLFSLRGFRLPDLAIVK
jgi:fucose 4-O-acetylase-like acetyltransferase